MIDFLAVSGALDILSSNWTAWAVIIPGLLLGLIGGSMPGISISMTMAIFLPLTLYMDFFSAVMFLTAIFTGGGFGGSVPAVLMNIPGTPSAVATTFDGYPMTQQGRHNEALGLALFASCIGTLAGYVLLFLLIEPLSIAVLRLGPLEMLVVALWGLILIAALRGRHVARGLMAGVFGVLMGTLGMNDAGYLRGTFGIDVLLDGVPTIPAIMGLFVAAQLFNLIGRDYIVADEGSRRMSFRLILAGVRETMRYPGVLLRGSAIGIIVGAVPGVGSSVSNLLSYAETRRTDPNPASFGTGNPKGVVAAESANSSSEGGSMATLLALGIPGGGGTAILLAAFATHNIVGGPKFLADHKDIVYAIIFGNFIQALLLLGIGLAFIHVASGIVKVPLRLLVPSVMVLSSFGAYSITGNLSGPVTLLVFSLLGWLLARYDYPVAATVVGLLLGRLVESELLHSYQLSAGEVSFLLQRPVAMVFLFLLVASLLAPFLRQWRGRSRIGPATPVGG
ncbi:MAG: tripartite tricarboxylate transporter permease [Acetobacterales bacterium]